MKCFYHNDMDGHCEVHYSVINRWLREAGFGIRNIKLKKRRFRIFLY